MLPIAVLLMAATTTATTTGTTTVPGQVPATEPRSFDENISGAAILVDAGKAEAALVLLDSMLGQTDLPIEKGKIEGLRSFALARLNRIPEARKAIEAAVASSPAPTMLLLRQLFLLRAFNGDAPGASETLQLIAATDPEGLSELPTEIVSGVIGAVAKDPVRSFEVDYSLVQANWLPDDATISSLDQLRLRLVVELVKRERVDDARAILADVLNPIILVRIGIDKRLQALWPEVETRLGPGADIADAVFVAAAKARYDAAQKPAAPPAQRQPQALVQAPLQAPPQALIARLGYAEALNIASREPEALALLSDVVKTPAELAALNDREIWLVNLQAALLGDTGKVDEALARYDALNAAPIEGRPGLIGTIINQGLFAQGAGRAEKALAVADMADSKGPFANEFARAYTAQVRACALRQLGKPAEANAAVAALAAKPEINDSAYISAMICLDRMDDAAAAVVQQLASEDGRNEMLFELQPFLINDRPGANDPKQRAGMRALKARTDVKAAFAKVGRDLPARVSPPR
ncbi:hypothetical protein GCM10011529_26920 [Polymorphobacter glacialis]|uniref:Tetratricopeptide repeat protein n=2 Tax=Sandarakinorhabdus glacialis TaxID=1614636 RepID=A0A917EAY0_9SPHN|nr:hypothetical protein GCM10011529_26920 [Polymorphobacter glacialis]